MPRADLCIRLQSQINEPTSDRATKNYGALLHACAAVQHHLLSDREDYLNC